jgi:glycosyltransferase involved in cell wall biosynthesis
MKVSVVIPTYNRNDILPQTLDMVLDQTWPDCQVIVVDQSPVTTDELAEYLAKHDGWIEYYRLPSPNLPAARNFGICRATGEVVIFIDDDVEIPRDYVEAHARSYCDPSTGGVSGLMFNAEQSLEYRMRLPTPIAANCGAMELAKWVCGGNTSYRRQALIEAGLFDERFGGSGWCEDADMSLRVRRLGYRLYTNPAVRMLHLALPSGGCQNRNPDFEEETLVDHFLLWLFFCKKHRDMIEFREFRRGLFGSYKALALNRKLVSRGAKAVLRRHMVFLVALLRGLRAGVHEETPAS